MFKFRVRVVLIVVFGGFLMVSTRLFYLQVVRGQRYQEYASNVRLSQKVAEAGRGRVYAAAAPGREFGECLAYDAPSFNLALIPRRLPEWRALCRPVLHLYKLARTEKLESVEKVDVAVTRRSDEPGHYDVGFELVATFCRREGAALVPRKEHLAASVAVPAEVVELLARLAALTEQPVDGMLERFFSGLALVGRGWRRASDPCVVGRDITFGAAAEIESHSDRYRGACIVASAKRRYEHARVACHVLGYMQCVSAGEYDRWRESYAGSAAKRFFPDDQIGRLGIEQAFEPALRPARGEMTLEVDAGRRTQKVLDVVEPVPGLDVHLTIDLGFQKAVEEALASAGCPGAIIVLETRTGRVLAMASWPTFDANLFPHEWPDPEDPLVPMLNRAIGGQYPLGSAFKLLLAIAALEEEVAPSCIFCNGWYHGSQCANHPHMNIDLHNAIKRSCNVYFYTTGQERLKVRGIVKWGAAFGFGRRTGIDVPGERAGLLPTPEWKKRRKHEAWYRGDTRNLSIGQGFLLVTPLQVARFVMALANGGQWHRPRIVDKVAAAPEKAETTPLPLHGPNLERVRWAMRGVCHEPHGTARRAWQGWREEQGYEVAGKTSTADRKLRGADGAIKECCVGWFVGFAPYKNPRVAFVVALEHDDPGIHGGEVAAPLTRRVLAALPEHYLKGVPGRRLRAARRLEVAKARALEAPTGEANR